jgi:anaerobic selenocysteine-containing dehydrogenase
MVEIVKSTCGLCEIACGIDVHVENGRVVEIKGMPEHVINQICAKGSKAKDWEYSPDRLMHPLERTGEGFKEITWDEALDKIGNKLNLIKEQYGGRALACYIGSRISLRDTAAYIKRFCDVYGTPNFLSGASYCFYPKVLGNSLTLGYFTFPSYRGTKCIVLWGTNPTASSLAAAAAINRMKVEGAKLIIVDPRKIPFAKKADLHLQLRPGTDSALALGVLNVIIEEELYDKKFVEEWTVGFDKLTEHIKKYTPEEVEKITWVNASDIRDFARTYARSKPASILQGLSLDPCTNGIQAIRAIAILIAITGNFDIPGGNIYHPKSPLYNALDLPEIAPKEGGFSKDIYPLFHEYTSLFGPSSNECSASPLPETIIKEEPYPIKGVIVVGSNPVVTTPNSNKIRESFKKLDLLVVMDPFMTETAELAHFVLPSATYLETTMLAQYSPNMPLTTLHNKAVDPPGGCWPDWKFWFELARKMGYGEYFPWNDVEEAIDSILKKDNITLKDLKEGDPRGVFHGSKQLVKRYKREGFNTPSKKVEIYSEKLEKLGYDPLPTYHEPAESPFSTPDLAKEYPLILTTGARVPIYTHSMFRNIPSYNKVYPEPKAEIHPETAEKYGINDGDWIYIESQRGRIKMKADLTEDILPMVVSVPHGWGGDANANILTDDMKRDPISGTPGYRSSLCRIEKA